MFVARNKDRSLYIFNTSNIKDLYKEDLNEFEPFKEPMEVWSTYCGDFMEIPKYLFPEVKWEDKEPTEVELIIKIK